MAKIVSVLENSVGEELGIKTGDDLIGVNNLPLQDILQYFYFDKQKKLTLNVKNKEGTYVFYKVEKDPSEILGLEFDDSLDIVPLKSENKVLYDFKKHLPRKYKNNLEENNDDWRLSVLHGEYVTLSNLSPKDLNRILKEKPGTLYIDYPAFDTSIASKMLGLIKHKNTYAILKILAKHKINMQAQIVLCPGLNDGEVLKQTIKKLSKLYPYLNSVSIQCAQVSDYDNSSQIEPVLRTSADKVLNIINRFNIWFNQKHNSNFVFANDEIYYRAKKVIPNANYYGDFAQLENGVGQIAKMRREADILLKKIKIPANIVRRVNIVVAECYFDFMSELAERINNRFRKVKVKAYKIYNNTLGRNIISNKLICGNDIILQLSNKNIIGKVVLLRNMLCEGEEKFIDDITVQQLSNELKVAVEIVDVEGNDLVHKILQEDRK